MLTKKEIIKQNEEQVKSWYDNKKSPMLRIPYMEERSFSVTWGTLNSSLNDPSAAIFRTIDISRQDWEEYNKMNKYKADFTSLVDNE